MTIEVKICGLRSEAVVEAAVEAGADLIAFNFFPRSPRYVSADLAARLAGPARGRAKIVALSVDASDAEMEDIVERLRPDLLQLHGAEDPARVAAIRGRFGIPVMKAIRVAEAADLAPIDAFHDVVDRFLFDAKAPPSHVGAMPGGNGLSFDWRLVKDLDPGRPAMLSGGLDAANVAEAIRMTGMRAVDVSSGVERAPGEKDPALIAAFIRAARAALLDARLEANELEKGSLR